MEASELAQLPQPAIGDERERAWRRAVATERTASSRRHALPPDKIIPHPGYTGLRADADKHAVVAAVLNGQIVLGQALRDYMLSLEEFADWLERFRLGPVMSACQVERRVLVGEMREWLE